jgi:hypothetical protein
MSLYPAGQHSARENHTHTTASFTGFFESGGSPIFSGNRGQKGGSFDEASRASSAVHADPKAAKDCAGFQVA